MAELLGGYKRTKMCGEYRGTDIDTEVVVMGFVGKFRNLGNLIFMDVRDRSGIVQVSFDDSTPKAVFEKAEGLRAEFVVCVKGIVRSRGANINKNIPTGDIEIIANDLKILSEAEVPPFVISDNSNVSDVLRLKYRYLDLRRKSLMDNLVMRDKISKITRDYLSDNGFIEVETPILGRSTPEGARDYLVPSRVHAGEFYALPQSPQQYKQLLMISGVDRYYQIAKCFRDEDLRANRQPEFTQIDLEMSYVEDAEDVMELTEGLIKTIFGECRGLEFNEKFRRIPWKYAMDNYGSDKPDTRYGMLITDLSEIFKDSEFTVFSGAVKNGGFVKAINAKGMALKLTRKQIDALQEFVKSYGAKGLAWSALKADNETSTFSKMLTESEIESYYKAMNAEVGDLILVVAADYKTVSDSLGALRRHIADTYDLYDKSTYDFLWITDFPLLEYDEEEKRYVAVHHPFTSVKPEDRELLNTNPALARASAYDLVINGEEAGGGSVRIHDYKAQEQMFSLLGFSESDIIERFGYFVEAFKYGVPPHAGLAFGLDRLVMLINGTDNIKDVIAFPKMQNAKCLMTDAPNIVEDKQLNELSLIIKENEYNL